VPVFPGLSRFSPQLPSRIEHLDGAVDPAAPVANLTLERTPCARVLDGHADLRCAGEFRLLSLWLWLQ
jgi:hypothetical protein